MDISEFIQTYANNVANNWLPALTTYKQELKLDQQAFKYVMISVPSKLS